MDMPHTHPAYKGTRPATHATGDVFQTTNLRDGEYLSRRADTAFHIRNVRQENIVPRNSYGEWERTGHLDAAPADVRVGHQITTTDGSTHLARAVGAEGVQIERAGSGMTATLPWDRVFASKEIPPTFTEGAWGTPETVTVTELERPLDAALGQLGAGAAADDPRTALDFEDENPYALPQEGGRSLRTVSA
ncbi:hypothetical protein [Microbacterium sp. NPDC055455]